MSQSMTEAKETILGFFDEHSQSVYRQRELAQVLSDMREEWDFHEYVGPKRFTDFLMSNGRLRLITLKSKRYSNQKRYVWGEASPFEVALSIRPGGYLSHGTAVFLHGLSEQIPKLIYVNKEQSAKNRPKTGLSQDRLRFALSRKQRESQYILDWEAGSAILLSGKATDKLEVGDIEGPNGEALLATKLERTLIDIIVRPAYAGGIFEVAEVYKNARELVSVELLVKTLRELDYLYPYHQAIGFVMERSGYDKESTEQLKELGLEFDFYLQHGLKDPEYDSTWKLFIPKGF